MIRKLILILAALALSCVAAWGQTYQNGPAASLPSGLPLSSTSCVVGSVLREIASPSTLIATSGLPIVTPQDCGAAGNGTTDDTSAVQSWLTLLKTGSYQGQCKGVYDLTSSVNGFSATNAYRVSGASMEGCVFYVNFNGWGSAAIDLTNPISPTSSNRGQSVEWDHTSFKYNPALTAPPIAFQDRYATNLYLHDIYCAQYTVNKGTCIAISDAWNSRWR